MRSLALISANVIDVVDCPTQLICTWIFICSTTKLKKNIAGKSATPSHALTLVSVMRPLKGCTRANTDTLEPQIQWDTLHIMILSICKIIILLLWWFDNVGYSLDQFWKLGVHEVPPVLILVQLGVQVCGHLWGFLLLFFIFFSYLFVCLFWVSCPHNCLALRQSLS